MHLARLFVCVCMTIAVAAPCGAIAAVQPAVTAGAFEQGQIDGGFAPNTRLLFGGVAMTIAEAEQTEQPTVTMVTQTSAHGQLIFQEVPVEAFYHRAYKGGLVSIETWDGDVIELTMTHPLVTETGHSILARDVAVESRLRGIDGITTVMRTRQSPYDGEVWHIVPKVGADAWQVVIAQNLLSDTLPAQQAYAARPVAAHN